jgi:hypothetical protein
MRCEHIATESRINGSLKELCVPTREHRVVEGVARLEKGKGNHEEQEHGDGRTGAEAGECKEHHAHNAPDGDLAKEESRVRPKHAAHTIELRLKDAKFFAAIASCCHALLLHQMPTRIIA